MRIGTTPPIRKPLPLTPLVDIVFLLLMFFMLSSTFTKFGMLQSGAAGEGVAAGAAQGFPGAIIMIEGGGALTLNGSPLKLEQLAAALDRLHADGVTMAALRAAKTATVQDLVSALDAARHSSIANIAVAP